MDQRIIVFLSAFAKIIIMTAIHNFYIEQVSDLHKLTAVYNQKTTTTKKKQTVPAGYRKPVLGVWVSYIHYGIQVDINKRTCLDLKRRDL